MLTDHGFKSVADRSDRPEAAPAEEHSEAHTVKPMQVLAEVKAHNRELEMALERQGELQRQLEADLDDARLLQSISAMMIDEHDQRALYQRLVDVATQVMRSDFGTIQRYDRASGQLELIVNRGLNDAAVDFWRWVQPGRATTCGKALEFAQRVFVADFDHCDFLAGSDDLLAFRRAGVRAAQSTPLLTRTGQLVGMISTHWTRPWAPQDRDLRLLDIVARQAADLIERNESEAALARQTARLLEADRLKDEFLATLAHELRNPLAPIQSGLALLMLGNAGHAPRIHHMMERQLGHMVRLIDDLLDVSRISRGKVSLKRSRVSLGAIIDSAVETSSPSITAAQHKFTITRPGSAVWLDADMTRITQVISNLLNNAAKYTPPGGSIELIAEVAEQEAVIRVIDTGIGISPAMLPKIFELFTQVDSSSERSQGGLGVGLALAKQLTEMHGGSISVESNGLHCGAVFTLRLPVAAMAPAVSPLAQPELQPGGAARRILVVDDNADAADTLAALLDQLGHTTCVELESRKALAVALEFKPDMVFLDLGMPYLNGFDLARQIRAERALSQVTLIALSGWGTDEDRAKSSCAGMDRHLIKPVMLKDVLDALTLPPPAPDQRRRNAARAPAGLGESM